MKILAISGGTPNRNNDSMAKEALMGAQEAGAEIEFIRLLDLNIRPCMGCEVCTHSAMKGGDGECVIKNDDCNWLDEKMKEADGVIIVMPIFQKGAPGAFRVIHDRLFGPTHDYGIQEFASRHAKEIGLPGPDPRKFEKKAVSFISLGGSDWVTKASTDMKTAAMAPLWTVIDDEVFAWSKHVIMDDERVARVRQVGVNIANAAKDLENAKYMGEPGVCPCCHGRNFYIHMDGVAECEVCAMKGALVVEDGKVTGFDFPEENLKFAHTRLSGKQKHMSDLRNNKKNIDLDYNSDEFKNRVEKYKAFIKATKPERA